MMRFEVPFIGSIAIAYTLSQHLARKDKTLCRNFIQPARTRLEICSADIDNIPRSRFLDHPIHPHDPGVDMAQTGPACPGVCYFR